MPEEDRIERLRGLALHARQDVTPVADQTRADRGWIKDEPTKHVLGHRGTAVRTPLEYRRWWETESPDFPYGLCWCGCGFETRIVRVSGSKINEVKGEPRRYVRGHESRGRTKLDRRNLTQEQEAAVCRLYLQGETGASLGERFGVFSSTIYRTLRLSGIPRRTESHNRYPCDDAFFDSVDTEIKAYWLGFIAADGCVLADKPVLSIGLAARDADHLALFKRHIGSDKPLYWRNQQAFGGSFPGAALHISPAQLIAGLAVHGIHPPKVAHPRMARHALA